MWGAGQFVAAPLAYINIMKYIDIHCHLDFPDYGTELAEVLARMKEREVGAITIGADLESSKRAVKIAEEAEKTGNEIWACIGVHPVDSVEKDRGDFDESAFEEVVSSPKVVAIGECGLDFFRIEPAKLETERKRQTEIFERQIQFALKYEKPLMLHCRNAYNETLDILENYKKEAGDKLIGNSHFFAGNIEQAKRFLDIGFTCSFTGVITFTHDYDEVIKYLPLDSIMSETDAPFVAPVPHRGKRNEPVFVIEVVKKIAEIRGESLQNVESAVINNSKRIFDVNATI